MAIELFRKSTMDAVKSGVVQYNINSDPQVRLLGVPLELACFACALAWGRHQTASSHA